jgi:hypothetical protein
MSCSNGPGGNLAHLTTLDYDLLSGTYSGARGHTHFTHYGNFFAALYQGTLYFYIPKGTKSLDMEVWDPNNKQLSLYLPGLPIKPEHRIREVDVSKRTTYTIALNPGEDGSIAVLSGDPRALPHLYSVPMLWAKSPVALLVPRAIAKADGLTVKE